MCQNSSSSSFTRRAHSTGYLERMNGKKTDIAEYFFSLWDGRLPGRAPFCRTEDRSMPFFFPPFSKGFHLGFQVNGCAPGSAAHTPSRLHKGALLWGEDTVVSGWVASSAALFICLPPARQELRLPSQAGRERHKKEKKNGLKSPLPPYWVWGSEQWKGKAEQSFPKQLTDVGGISGADFTLGELIVASLPVAAIDFQLPIAGSYCCLHRQ